MNECIKTLHLAAVTLAAGSAFGLQSQIQHVELYPSGAAVTREVILGPYPESSKVIELADLPSSVIASSFQIAPIAGVSVQVGGFTFLPTENPVEEDDPRTAALRDTVDKLADRERILKEQRAAIEARITHYDYVVQSIRKSLEEDADSDTFELIQTAWQKLESVREEGLAELAKLTVAEKELAIQIKEAKKDLSELVSELNRRSGVLRFDIAGKLDEEIRLLVRYQVREAGWSPVHEIRANPAKGQVSWIYKARITQNTGEDWNGVQVSLNSASALYGGSLPPLPPLILRRIEARGGYVSSRAKSMEQDVMELAPFAVAADGMQGAAQPASTTTGFFIHLPRPVSLESGKEALVREAFTSVVEAEFWSEAVPELSNEAWLMAGMTNDIGWPILAGESYSYIDGQLVSRRHIAAYASGEEMEFALGRNEKISLERKERVKKESEGGLIDKTKRHDIKYETTVTNQMAVAHRIVLQDRFPIGQDNKIQVRIISPKDVEPEEGTGIFKWERVLQPGKQAVMETEYTVTYPADWTIQPPLD